ncbi:MAG: hypothetical protein J5I99_09555 [Verrucomicrobia bacterium]|nr:hypothetical protein [Verrucomicrobiota bacterium]
MRNSRFERCLLVWIATTSVAFAADADLRLVRELTAEGDHAGSAIEFRRLALSNPDADAQAVYFWSAAFELWRAGDFSRADTLLDRAEDLQALPNHELTLLRGELALSRSAPGEAAFFFESAARDAEGDARDFSLRKQVAAQLISGDREAAQRTAMAAGGDVERIANEYTRGRSKSPTLGGWLGLVPGLGYAYAGEYANAARSVILNGLFIWGMVETAERDQWGGFAALTFFEFTWYSGSIYGGVDASHRYNQRRLKKAEAALTAGYALQPDYTALPALQLRYRW